jgi:hypothetical protein
MVSVSAKKVFKKISCLCTFNKKKNLKRLSLKYTDISRSELSICERDMEAETASLHGPHKNMQIVVLKEQKLFSKPYSKRPRDFFCYPC